MEKTVKFVSDSFGKRLKSMLKVDFRRMFRSKLFYILIGCAFVIPILITVMMTMMDGSVSVDPQTGVETVMEGPENAWQSIGTLPDGVLSDDGDESSGGSLSGNGTESSGGVLSENGTESADGTFSTDGTGASGGALSDEVSAMGGMDVMSMCNINMMFMLVAVFICLFISDDFRSGFAKNLFTVRAKKGDYVVSKTLAGFVCGALLLIAYFIGAMLGGAISGLSFDLGPLNTGNIVMCMIAKIFLMFVFVAIFVLVSVAAKQKAWLAICGSLGAGMLLFMMVSMITPLGSTIMNVILCIAGGALFAFGLGAISNNVLKKTSLV